MSSILSEGDRSGSLMENGQQKRSLIAFLTEDSRLTASTHKIMEKRTILAIALSALVFIGFQWYQQHYMKPAEEKQEVSVSRFRSATSGANPEYEPLRWPRPSPVHQFGLPQQQIRTPHPERACAGGSLSCRNRNKGGVLTSWELMAL